MPRPTFRHLIISAILIISGISGISANSQSSASDCFPFERLPSALQPKAEALLLKALDGEALYTIAGGLKPMSSGIYSGSIKVDAADLARRAALPRAGCRRLRIVA